MPYQISSDESDSDAEADNDMHSGSGDVSSDDAEESKALNEALKKGRLKPGINIEIPKQKTFTNNVAGLQEKLAEISKNLEWIERLDITSSPRFDAPSSGLPTVGPTATEEADDDFKREMAIYYQAQDAVKDALERLHAQGVPTQRPDDYFAEMVKTDDHMKKVREKLLEKKQTVERREKARKLRELRKYGKKVQQEVTKKRHEEKRHMNEAVKKYRKGLEGRSLDFLDKAGAGADGENSGGASRPQKKTKFNAKVSGKREFRNKKFGYGGQKKRSKYNTAASAGDVSGFRPMKKGAGGPNRAQKPKHKQGKGKVKQKNWRPGKKMRKQLKNMDKNRKRR